MKTLYLECNMGAAGDMLMASLLELLPEPKMFLDKLNNLGIPNVQVDCMPSIKCGITGSHISVTVNGEEEESVDVHQEHGHDHEHEQEHHHDHEDELNHNNDHEHHHNHEHTHTGMHEIEHLINGHLDLSQKVRQDVFGVYRLLAEAEGHVHDRPVDQIHFHEVGTMDAVADIVGVCMLMEMLAPNQVIVSPVHVGSGQVRCAHGILPVPAPATAYILRDVPMYSGNIRGELCTPTGAALLKHFATKFGTMPVMTVSAIGYGMGTKDFEAANCVRTFLGYTDESVGEVSEICCNLDDMTPEAIGFVTELLFENGALDVYTIPIGMKKSRPGILLCCMSRKEQTDTFVNLILRHTTSLGVRISDSRRVILNRSQSVKQTAYGSIRIKTATGNGITKSKPEYEDVAKIAKENGMTLSQVVKLIKE